MRRDWELTKEEFDALLNWLDPDREQAAREYERIRRRLIRFFLGRRCPAADELTDETINRVAVRVPKLANFEGDKALFFLGVAHFVHREWIKRPVESELPPDIVAPANGNDREKKDECLTRCFSEFAEEGDLFKKFHDKEKRAKIEHRKMLADELGITLNALRIRVHRIRTLLKECMANCLEELPAH